METDDWVALLTGVLPWISGILQSAPFSLIRYSTCSRMPSSRGLPHAMATSVIPETSSHHHIYYTIRMNVGLCMSISFKSQMLNDHI